MLAAMAPARKKHQSHHVKAWREYRELTQEALAERVGVTQEAISKLERGATGYTQAMLEALAKALDCTPAELIQRDPNEAQPLWAIIDQIDPRDLPQIKKVLETYKKAG